MILLAIDYGEKNIGLAFASGPLAEPLENLKVNKEVTAKITQYVLRLKADKVIVGVSEGIMAEKTRAFANELSRSLPVPVELQDETLSSRLALQKLKESKAKKKKRFGPLHSFAATIILQDYLDQFSDQL